MSEGEEPRRTLPTSRAFVLQIHADSRVETGRLAGRIEHITTGQASHFESVDDLLAFIADALREGGTAGQ